MIKIQKIKPLFTNILTTMNVYKDEDAEEIILEETKQEGQIKEYQTVKAIGSMVRDIKVGDVILINPSRFAVKKHQEGSLKDGIITDNPIVQYNFPIIEIGGENCLMIQNTDVDFVIEEYTE